MRTTSILPGAYNASYLFPVSYEALLALLMSLEIVTAALLALGLEGGVEGHLVGI